MAKGLVYRTEGDMRKDLDKKIADWKVGQSTDGFVFRAEGKFTYKGIAYLIKVIRYYNNTKKFTPMCSSRISDCHCVVEFPDETKPIVELVKIISEYNSEFLYHDTLHGWNDNQTTEEQIKECHKLAKNDIDNLLSGKLYGDMSEKISKLNEAKEKIESLIGRLDLLPKSL